MIICSIEGCGRQHLVARGWCQLHYRRWQRHGDPLGGGTPNGAPEKYFQDVVLAYASDECVTWPFGKCRKGYGQMWRDGKLHIVSRLVCEEVHGAPPTPKHEAAHSCGNGHEGCVNPHHLSWKTRTQNQADKLLHGTHNRGERHRKSKLTENKVREIRALHGRISQTAIAGKFGISQTLVSRIRCRKNWSWLAS